MFNGDADGICALQQLRLAQPREAVMVTGVKRDIALLARVPAQAGDTATVLDISLERNRAGLDRLLAAGVAVEYFDHHCAGTVPRHPLLRPHLDPAPDVCTSVLVDRFLGGRHRRWAVVGAFGDGLPATAQVLGEGLGLSPAELAALRVLGEALNYNAYGETEADLLVPPARLAQLVRPYADPLAFAAEVPLVKALREQRSQDLELAFAVPHSQEAAGAAVVVLPDAPWARRVQGTFAHALAEREPQRAHAVLCRRGDGSYAVSVRAPRACPQGAHALCVGFPGGGGRAGAAGIDALPATQLQAFLQALARAYPEPATPAGQDGN